MNEKAKKIRELYTAETGMTYNVVFAFDGSKEPWVGTIGTYSARGSCVDSVLDAIYRQQCDSLQIKKRVHVDALKAIETALV